ncbi:hypothetical protein K438DRAFT_2012169 [Mycena galopus ATCC 62051]|nr:hypothetical protein K438DRAFT_2012169 [Mycena galopus ATCC 62051]
MPPTTIRAERDSSKAQPKTGPNIGLVAALIVMALLLLGALVALLILKRRRNQSTQPSTHKHKPFMAKAGRVLDKIYPGHNKGSSDSMGPLLPVRAETYDHLPLQDYVAVSPVRPQSGPIDLWFSAPRSAPTPPPERERLLKVEVEHRRPSPAPPSQDHVSGGEGRGRLEDCELSVRSQCAPIDLWISPPRSATSPPPECERLLNVEPHHPAPTAPLPDHVSGGEGRVEDRELGLRLQSDPIRISPARSAISPPPERQRLLTVPDRPLPAAPIPVSPISPVSPNPSESETTTESVYPDERSESARTRIRTADFAALFPSVPPLPEDLLQLQLRLSPPLRERADVPANNSAPASTSTAVDPSENRSPPIHEPIPTLPHHLDPHPRSDLPLPPETPPLDVAAILKMRAKRRANTPEHRRSQSLSRTSHIERPGSIKEAPTPVSPCAQEVLPPSSWRSPSPGPPPPKPQRTRDTVADTLEYYTSQPGSPVTDEPHTIVDDCCLPSTYDHDHANPDIPNLTTFLLDLHYELLELTLPDTAPACPLFRTSR